MTVDPADQEFLDAQHWVIGTCAIGHPGHQAAGTRVVEIDHIEQGNLAGYPVYSCRRCLEYRLGLDRAWAEGEPSYTPQLRRPAGAGPTGLLDLCARLRPPRGA